VSPVWFGDTPATSQRWYQVPTTTAVGELIALVNDAEELWIDDPLAFPWDTLGNTIAVPATVKVGTSLLDLAALAPWLQTLGAGDRIVCDDTAIQAHVTAEFATSDSTANTSLAERTRTKTIRRDQVAIIERLTHEARQRGDGDRVRIETIPLEMIIAPGSDGSFLDTVTRHMAPHGPGTVTEVWGLRDAPGAPLAGAVIAYRLDAPVGAAP